MNTEGLCHVDIDLQNPNQYKSVPEQADIKLWCEASIQNDTKTRAFKELLTIVVRVVDIEESAALNLTYRNKNGPTNVLSYPNQIDDFMLDIPELKEQNSHIGDLVICAPLVKQEAAEQNKAIISHWAHLIVHGVLHLQGYDHLNDIEANEMESLEITILEQFGFDNPYRIIN